MQKYILGLLAGFAMTTAASAGTAPPGNFSCGGAPPGPPPVIAPKFIGGGGDFTNLGNDCAAWQNFIYVNWPAAARGVPDPNAKFGADAPTVWETYKTAIEVFLPNGANPGPWDTTLMLTAYKSVPSLAQKIADGHVRYLTETSKVSHMVLANVQMAQAAKVGMLSKSALDDIVQVGGGKLYDLNSQPVYYEIAINQSGYEYIVNNGLYDATKQAAFAAKNVIALPGTEDKLGPAVEMKAAWKILSKAEQASGRFHMVQAVAGPTHQKVMVGLVGLHMFTSSEGQGFWATFSQVDNAPVQVPAKTGSFNFFNPKCVTRLTHKPCPINVKSAKPGQVVQLEPDDVSAVPLNTYMQALLNSYDPKGAWQYYKLINVQWPLKGVPLSTLTAPQAAPLPLGGPNTNTLLNPVLETFLQKKGGGCLNCHVFGQTAAVKGSKQQYASGYSFMFGRATSPKK
jgi:hypothetical protein